MRNDKLGCGYPVSYQFVYTISADICGEADKGGVARQRREFKTYRKSTAQQMTHISGKEELDVKESVGGKTELFVERRRSREGGELLSLLK